ncbi:MAG: zinc ABC transporter substrate-binding protein [Clostridiales bacterium]|nr:zinc ABC transporter substrate-binding protein [Clostridiales bacterium]
MRKFKIIGSYLMLVLIFAMTIFSIVYFSHKNKEGKVVTTIFPIYDICREILGNDEDIVMLQDNGTDMHSYQATASDIATLSKAELFIMVGGSSDKWVGDVIRSANNVNLSTLSLMDIVNKVEESDENISEGEHHHEHGSESSEGHHHEEEVHYDEHIWLSIKNMILATRHIKDALIKVFPERTELIRENAEGYLNKLIELEQAYADALLNQNAFYLVADRFPFIYLMNDYGMEYHAAFSGCSAETEASAETMSELINKVNEKSLEYIYITETADGSIAEQVKAGCSNRNNIKILVVNSCQSVSIDDVDNMSYLSIMTDNLEKFKKGVKQ